MFFPNIVQSSAVLAQAADDAAGGSALSLVILVVLGAVLWFLMIRPQRRRQQAMREFQGSLDVGDRVRTAGGLIGVVSRIDEREVVIATGGIELPFVRGAIVASEGGDDE